MVNVDCPKGQKKRALWERIKSFLGIDGNVSEGAMFEEKRRDRNDAYRNGTTVPKKTFVSEPVPEQELPEPIVPNPVSQQKEEVQQAPKPIDESKTMGMVIYADAHDEFLEDLEPRLRGAAARYPDPPVSWRAEVMGYCIAAVHFESQGHTDTRFYFKPQYWSLKGKPAGDGVAMLRQFSSEDWHRKAELMYELFDGHHGAPTREVPRITWTYYRAG